MENMVRLWTHGETTSVDQDTDAGYDAFLYADQDSVDLPADLCDEYYAAWASSDYMGSFFAYVQQFIIRYTPVPAFAVNLTDEDRAIFARRWMQKTFPNFHAMLEGDHSDYDVMLTLREICESHGSFAIDDLNIIERDSYVFWIGECSAAYEFDPIYHV